MVAERTWVGDDGGEGGDDTLLRDDTSFIVWALITLIPSLELSLCNFAVFLFRMHAYVLLPFSLSQASIALCIRSTISVVVLACPNASTNSPFGSMR